MSKVKQGWIDQTPQSEWSIRRQFTEWLRRYGERREREARKAEK